MKIVRHSDNKASAMPKRKLLLDLTVPLKMDELFPLFLRNPTLCAGKETKISLYLEISVTIISHRQIPILQKDIIGTPY